MLLIIILLVLIVILSIIVIVLSILYHAEKQRTCLPDNGLTGKGPTDNANYCGKASFGDPRAFGPTIWKSLHIMAQYYPDDPTDEQIKECRKFILSLPWMLPGGGCGKHLQEFIDYNIEHSDSTNKECSGVGKENECLSLNGICKNKRNLILFFVRAHNNVSKHVNPDRKPFTLADAEKLYSNTNMCFHNEVFPSESLKRSK